MAHRKLQAEIDRVLKKVDEGVIQFEETWDKVKDATTPNLKEKYEGDLKKEIKKLQRYRDQIKTWAGSNEVKKKQPLIDARKLIETKMEKFKILEKETKTKAYSKEGLSKSLKKKKDPTADPKYKSYQWIEEAKGQIDEQLTDFEERVDGLKGGGKKKQRENQNAIDDLVLRIERHNWHLEKLDEMRDRLEKGDITVKKVEEIKDNVMYYIESNQDPDFYEDEYMYDAMDEPDVEDEPKRDSDSPGLPVPEDEDAEPKEEDDVEIAVVMPTQQVSANYAPAPKAVETKDNDDKDEKKNAKSGGGSSGGGSNNNNSAHDNSAASVASPAVSSQSQQSVSTAAVVAGNVSSNGASPALQPMSTSSSVPRPVAKKATVGMAATGESFASLLRRNSHQGNSSNVTSPPLTAAAVAARVPTPTTTGATAASIVAHRTPSSTTSPAQSAGSYGGAADESPLILGQAHTGTHPQQRQMQQQQQHPSQPPVPQQQQQQQQPQQPTQQQQQLPPQHPMSPGQQRQMSQQQQRQHDSFAAQPQRSVSQPQQPFSRRTPFSSSNLFAIPISSEYKQGLQRMAPSVRFFPRQMDTDRGEAYTPRNPAPTNPSFPSVPLPEFDDPAMFSKFDTDTLFFIFYFQQGTPQQYLAARELRKQSWRYHKNFLTWFQRHEDPTHATDEYEQGTYVYFDYEAGWCSRIKKDFTFHYQHLEDELPNPGV